MSGMRRDAPKAASFAHDQQQIECVFGIIGYVVVFVMDACHERVIALLQAIAVHAIEDLVRNFQQRGRKAILQVEDIPSGYAPNCRLVVFVVAHNLFVARYTLDGDVPEYLRRQPVQLSGKILTYVPWIARQRHAAVGCREQSDARGLQHAMDLFEKRHVIANVFDHLEADDRVESRILGDGEWRNVRGDECAIRMPRLQRLDHVSDLIDSGVMLHEGLEQVDTTPFTASHLKQVPGYELGSDNISLVQPLMYGVVRLDCL